MFFRVEVYMAQENLGIKLIASNKRAHFDYFLSDFLEAGMSLTGTEVKSMRAGHCSINGAFIDFRGGEAYVVGMNIPEYKFGNIFNHEPLRDRKLLIHKYQIDKFMREVKQNGFTVVPTKVYFKKGRVKIEIALGKGKKNFDKRETIKERDIKRKLNDVVKSQNF